MMDKTSCSCYFRTQLNLDAKIIFWIWRMDTWWWLNSCRIQLNKRKCSYNLYVNRTFVLFNVSTVWSYYFWCIVIWSQLKLNLYFVQENLCHFALFKSNTLFSMVNFKSPMISKNNFQFSNRPGNKRHLRNCADAEHCTVSQEPSLFIKL